MGEGNNIYWLYTQNSTDDLNAFGKFEYIQSSGYDKYYRCLVELFLSTHQTHPDYRTFIGELQQMIA